MSKLIKSLAGMKNSCSKAAFFAAGMLPLAGLAMPAHAQSLQDALRQTTISGMAGVYDFTYANKGEVGKNTQNAFAVGGNLNLHTGAFEGFSVGLGGYTGQSLGLYSRNPNHDDSSELTSHTHSEQSLREAFLQYENRYLEVRGGRQFINTPFANQDLYTFNPRAFMGFAGVANIIGGNNGAADAGPLSLNTDTATLSVMATRMFNYNSRYSSDFVSGDRYLTHTNGFIAFGAKFQNRYDNVDYTAQGWYYNFYGQAQMFYGQADFVTPMNANSNLFGSAQMVSEGNSGSGFNPAGVTYNVDAHVYGGKLGMTFGDDKIAVIGDYSPSSYGSFHHGGMVHPYNDLSGTIFTDTMQNGIEDMGPGYAYGITGTIKAMGGKLEIDPTYVEYNADYGFGGSTYSYGGAYGFPAGVAPIHNESIHVIDAGFSYNLSDVLKGLSVAWDTDAAFAQNDSSQTNAHYDNPYFSSRFYLKYAF